MRYGHLGEIVLFICVPWFCWEFCRHVNAIESKQQELEFQRILETEVTNCKVGLRN